MKNAHELMKLGLILLSAIVLADAPAHAQRLYKWTDEKGRVHYSDKPMDSRSQTINASGNTASICEGNCRLRLKDDKFRARLDEEMRNVPRSACSKSYYAINPTSKKLAKAATEECKRNYAMRKIDPGYVPETTAQQKHKNFNKHLSREIKDSQRRLEDTLHRQQVQTELQQQQRQLDEIQRQQAQQKPRMPDEFRLRSGSTEVKCRNQYGVGRDYVCD